MRKNILTLIATLLFAASAWSQETTSMVIPGKGHIDVEQLDKKIDLSMDISQLSLSEIRVLRNAFAARQGYCFMNADLRALFAATSWYTSRMEDRVIKEMDNEPVKPITYTKAEQAFISKLKAREDELKKQNFKAGNGQRVNTDNLVNPFQMTSFNPQLKDKLGQLGFAIVPGTEDQLFHVYERNDYHQFPSFITTDLFLQTFHMFFDTALKRVETTTFYPLLKDYTRSLYNAMNERASSTKNKALREAAEWDAAYFAVAYSLITGEPLLPVADKWKQMAEMELTHVEEAQMSQSDFLDYHDVLFAYNIYRPRGHYTRSDELKRYFKCMMWLQNVPFATDKPDFLRRALLMADVVANNAEFTKKYQTLDELITYLMGEIDDVSILQVNDIVASNGVALDKLMTNNKELEKVQKKIEQLGDKQTRIVPKFQLTSRYKINFMPQRYMPDGEVLQEMVDYETQPTLRDVPKGLDIFAAMGVTPAERILIDELKEQQKWNQYKTNLQRMKTLMGSVDWNKTVTNRWMESLKALSAENHDQRLPYFMQTPQWQKKSLNSALASWAELKHDAILYAKQPAGAECGGLDIPDPVVRGYVEPNIAYWQKAAELLKATGDVFKRFGLSDEELFGHMEEMDDELQFLLSVSKKELEGKKLSDEEYEQIRYAGATFENITLGLLREPNQELMGWDDVQGADKSIAVVADVYTANAFNNPNKSVLYEAVGPAHEIYVIVEIEGYLYLTRGAVFSYREFQEGLTAPRLTDEEWQQQLEQQPNMGIPDWMKEIIVPIDNKELDNEHVFYSSGC